MMTAGTAKKKVLLVDDVKLFIALEKTFFQRKESIEVLVAGDGEEALRIFETENPDLVYMDLYMPKMNGDECCRIIKGSETGRNTPVVMVTSAGNEKDETTCREAGCDEVLTKPINRAKFLSVAKKYLEVHERKEPRYALHVKVRFGEKMEQVLTEFTVNISSGGLFLSSFKLLPVDTGLYVEFRLPESGRGVSCRARVAWLNDADNPVKPDMPTGMGLQFVDISEDEINAIRKYADENELTAEW